MKETMIEAWHFVGNTLRDGRPIPRDGEWLEHLGPAVICESGLHASRRPGHALQYAPGPVLCHVECDDVIEERDDKLVCRRRRIIWRADITETLRYYARIQVLSVIHFFPDPPDVLLDYLMTGNESIRAAARSAAWIAKIVAKGAAWGAARSTTWAVNTAALNAAWEATLEVALNAAKDVARETAWNAAWDNFDTLIYEQFGEAAR